MQELFRSIPQVFKDFQDNEAANAAIVFAAWRRISGETLGNHAVPVRFDKKKLVIAVSSDTWRKQVADLSSQMIFRLNAALGMSLVTLIEFRVDAKAVKGKRLETCESESSDKEYNEIAMKAVTKNIRLAAEAITDKNFRYQFLLAAGSSLIRNMPVK